MGILNIHIEDVIAKVDDGKPATRDMSLLDTIAVHRCGKDLKFNVDSGSTAEEVCAHFTGKDNKFPEMAKATGGEVPYSFMIGGNLGAPEADGVIWQCLPLSDIGRHAARWNVRAVGVAVIADPRVRPCSDAQYASLVDLLTLLCLAIKQGPSCIKGHMELPGASSDPTKVCPGPLLPLDVLRADVAKANADVAQQLAVLAGIRIK